MALGATSSCAAHRSGAVTCRGAERPVTLLDADHGAVEVAVGDLRSCARTSAGEVWCWHWYDQLQDLPVRLDDRTDAIQLAGNFPDGDPFTRGEDLYVLRRNGSVTVHPYEGPASTLTGVKGVVAIASSDRLLCFTHAGGEVSCVNLLRDKPALERFPSAERFTQVAVGHREICGVTPAGAVQCWQWEIYSAQFVAWEAPVQPPPVRLVVGDGFACGLASDGLVTCWGKTPWPKLGSQGVVGLPAVTDLFAGADQMCARSLEGSTWCLGKDAHGQIGDGLWHGETGSVRLPGLHALAAAAGVTCAASRGGAIDCWGTAEAWTRPVRVGRLAGVAEMVTSAAATCVRTADGVVCRELPHVDPRGVLRAEEEWRSPPGVVEVIDIDIKTTRACALSRDGRVSCWDVHASPVVVREEGRVDGAMALALPEYGPEIYVRTRGREVRCLGPLNECIDTSELQDVRRIALADDSVCALTGSGEVQCIVTSVRSGYERQFVASEQRYSMIDAFDDRICGIALVDDHVACWSPGGLEKRFHGSLGSAVAIATGATHVCIGLADGTVKCMGGENRAGELGNGRAANVPRPRLLPDPLPQGDAGR